jgi:hypothetical protein
LLKPQYVLATWTFTIVVDTIWNVRLFAYLWEFAVAAPVLPLDRRPPAERMMEARRVPPDNMRLIDRRQGDVLWIGGMSEAWFILGRPQWASPLQGNPAIFSSALAAEWRNRMQVLMDLRLADQKSFASLSAPESADLPRLSQEGVRQLCARGCAPAWIIAPLEQGKELQPGLK